MQALVACQLLALVEFLCCREWLPLRVAKRRVAVEAHLGVKRMHFTRGLQNQRIDLGEIAVAVHETAVQLDENARHAVLGLGRNPGVNRRFFCHALTQPDNRIDVQLHDRGWVFCCDFFDINATLCRQHQQVLLGSSVERERGVVLLGDVAGALDPHALDLVTLDVHADDVARMSANFVFVIRELDAACLAATTNLHLRLHDNRIPDSLSDGYRLIDGVRHVAGRYRDTERRKVLLALVFEEVH